MPTYTITIGSQAAPSYTIDVAASSDTSYNVLFILVDDIGVDLLSKYDDINPYTSSPPPGDQALYPATPYIDSLCDDGVRFRRAYGQPVCSPSRASWLTGLYPHNTGVGSVIKYDRIGTLAEFNDAPFTATTIVSRLQTAGYECGIAGKWHLGLPTVAMDSVNGNNSWQGWDHIPDVGLWDDWRCVHSNLQNRPVPASEAEGSYYEHIINRNGTQTTSLEAVQGDGWETPAEQPNYATTLQITDAIDQFDTLTEPFLVYVPLNTAHSPFNWPPQSLTATEEYYDTETAGYIFRAKVEALDAEIGRLLTGVDAGRLARTVIIFAGDNGQEVIALSEARDTEGKTLGGTYNALIDDSLARFKTSPFERGVQIPLIVKGPAARVASPGRTSDVQADITDLYPTILDLCGITKPSGLDGVSLYPALQNTVTAATHARQFGFNETFRPNGDWSTIPDSAASATNYYRRQYTARIVGSGTFKLLRFYDENHASATEYFYRLRDADDVDADPFEQADLIGTKTWVAEYDYCVGEMDALVSSGYELDITDEDGAAATVATDASGDIPITDEDGSAGTIDVVGTSIDITDEEGNAATVELTAI